MNCVGFFIYGLNYLTLYPKFICYYPTGQEIPEDSDDYTKMCQPFYFCDAGNEITFDIVQDDDLTLDNWTKKFDLICASDLLMSSFSMTFFIGFGLGSIFIPRLSDLYGRRKPLLILVAIQFLSIIGMYLVPGGSSGSVYWLLPFCFIAGCCAAGISATACSFMVEFTNEKWTPYI